MAAELPPLPPSSDLYGDAACGLLLTSREGHLLAANRTFCRWIGYAEAELVGQRRLQDLLTMGGRIFHQTHWIPLLQMQGSVAEVKLDMVHREGHTVPMMMNAARHEHEGTVWHHIATFVAEDRDKYERELLRARRLAEELLVQQRQAQQEVLLEQSRHRVEAEDRALFAEQMVGIVSHDLRNPLSAIQMGAYLLERGELTSNQRTVLGRITNSSGRAQRLIADLLDFTLARVGRGLTLSRVPVQLHQMVSDSVEELALAFPGRVLQHRPDGTGECFADADRLMQLIGNLVANASAYGSPDQPITISSRVEGGQVELGVHNHGTPIAPEVRASLFEPMIRGAGKGGRGVGLGLFIVREIARAHGGEVRVTSSQHEGTCFFARFPAAAPQA